MTKVKKTKKNPYGLSGKQLLVVDDLIRKIKAGEELNAVESTQKFYKAKNKNVAKVTTSKNFQNVNFRAALMNGLGDKKILGRDSKVEQRLTEGLDAGTKRPIKTKEGVDYVDIPDFPTRLSYIKEINKIAGVYAPEKRETKSMILKADITEEQLDEKIRRLQDELK